MMKSVGDEKRFDRYINLGITSEDMYFRLDEEFDMKKIKTLHLSTKG